MRQAILKLHRWIALPLGIFISLLCFTGATLVFQDEIIHALNAEKYRLNVPQDAHRLPDDELVRRVQAILPADKPLMAIEIDDADPTAPAKAMIMGLGHVDFLINPYTGEVYGIPAGTDFFRIIRELHRFLLNKPTNYQGGSLSTGRIIVGVSAIAMTFLLLTGFVLWWPHNRRQLKNRLKVSFTHGPRRFIYDTHVSLGIYAFTFLLLMSLTGPAWSFSWYGKATQTILGKSDRQQTRPHTTLLGMHYTKHSTAPQVRHITTAVPDVTPQGKNFRQLLSSLHFGQWGGLFTRILYFLAALIGATLPWSGYYLWWKRRRVAGRL